MIPLKKRLPFAKKMKAVRVYYPSNLDEIQSFQFEQLTDKAKESFFELKQYDQAIEKFQKVIQTDPTLCSPYFKVVLIYFHKEDYQSGIEQLKHAVTLGNDHDWQKDIVVPIIEINTYVFQSVPIHLLWKLIEQQQHCFEESNYLTDFHDGLLGALMEVLKLHKTIPIDRLKAVYENVLVPLQNNEMFVIIGRLFEIGVRFLESNDKRVLLELPLEERNHLNDLLFPKEKASLQQNFNVLLQIPA